MSDPAGSAHEGGAEVQNRMAEEQRERSRRLVEATREALRETRPQAAREQRPESTSRPETPADRWRKGEH